MEAVDTEVSVTCMDSSLIRKAFQLALLCTKKHPAERPNMHEVVRVLVSLLPAPLTTKSGFISSKKIAYTHLLTDENVTANSHQDDDKNDDDNSNSSSDGQWFVRFGEVISNNTL